MEHLFEYQKTGAQFLAENPAAFLADGPGLGKTIQVIAACDMLGLKKVVIVCPAIAKINWKREFAKWGKVERDILIYSYDKLTISKEARTELAKFEPDVLVLDECHALKNRQAKRTKYIYGQYCRGDGLVKFADRVWLLSGTPFSNSLADFWPHLAAIWRYPLNFIDYTVYFCKTWNGPFGLKVLGNKPERVGEFKTILKSIMLRRRAETVLKDLPPLVWGEASVEVSGWDDTKIAADEREKEAISIIIQNALAQNDLSDKVDNIAPHIASLRRLTSLAKAKPIAAQVAQELEDGAYEKIIVFAYHRDAIMAIAEGLSKFNPVTVVGGMASADRQAAIDDFQNDPSVRCFVGQITACNAAITLTAANQIVFAELDWTNSTNAQAAKRAHRIGQTRPVFIRVFSLANSVDEIVSRVLTNKARMISEVLD